MKNKNSILKKIACSLLSSISLLAASNINCTKAMNSSDKTLIKCYGSNMPPRTPISKIRLCRTELNTVKEKINIETDTLKHICHGHIIFDPFSHDIICISGGHLYSHKRTHDDIFNDNSVSNIVKEDIRNKTYFKEGYTEFDVNRLILDAIKQRQTEFEHIGGNKYATNINMHRIIGSNGERDIRICIYYDSDCNEYFLVSAYPVHIRHAINHVNQNRMYNAHGLYRINEQRTVIARTPDIDDIE